MVKPLGRSLRHARWFSGAADLGAQRAAEAKWRDPAAWWRSAILNTANVGFFSADRAIREYASEVWLLPEFTPT